jgi:hypothetical protein
MLITVAIGGMLAVLLRGAAGPRPRATVLGSAARTQKLEDVFSAPFDALASYVPRIDQGAVAAPQSYDGQHLPTVAMHPTAVALGNSLEFGTANGPMAITVDPLQGHDGLVEVHGSKGGQLYAGRVENQPGGGAALVQGPQGLTSLYHDQANASNPQGPSTRGWGLGAASRGVEGVAQARGRNGGGRRQRCRRRAHSASSRRSVADASHGRCLHIVCTRSCRLIGCARSC